MAGNHVLLETIALTQSATSVTFDNIPQTGYTDLKIVVSTRSTFTDTPVAVKFNAVTTGYSWKRIYGSGSAASSQSGSDNYFMYQNISSQTANTFGSGELYVPNYTGNQAKSCSFDSLNENNATAADMFMLAGLNTMTDAITAITFTPLTGSFAANSTFSLYGVAAFGTTPEIAPFATGGNIVANDGTYWYHAFLSSGNFIPQQDLTCDYLVIGGGAGGGGYFYGGGGGAGGYQSATNYSATSSVPLSVTIGAGGAGTGTDGVGGNGTSSVFGALTSIGGGGGNGQNGASGGGGQGATAGGTGTSGQGYNGGTGYFVSSRGAGGGGGGAGAVGGNGSYDVGGTGGAGKNTHSSWATATNTGVSGYYAGGGGGATYQYSSASNPGGAGGGGRGSAGGSVVKAVSGTAGTGSGGGGYSAGGVDGPSGNGGSGIVIIRYAMV